MWERLSQRERTLIVFFLFILLLTAYYFYIYLPLNEELGLLRQKKMIKEQELNSVKDIIRRLPAAKEEYNRLQGIELIADNDIFDIERFLKELADNTMQNRLTLKSFIPYRSGGNYNLNFAIIGVYSDLLSLLDWLENYQFVFQFKELSLRSAFNGEIEMNVKLLYE